MAEYNNIQPGTIFQLKCDITGFLCAPEDMLLTGSEYSCRILKESLVMFFKINILQHRDDDEMVFFNLSTGKFFWSVISLMDEREWINIHTKQKMQIFNDD